MCRRIGSAIAAAAALFVLAPAAHADHHFVSVSEVLPSTPTASGAEFVEFRMYSAGQGNFAPAASVAFYNTAGTVEGTLPLADAASAQNQDTLLVASQAAESEFGIQGDVDYLGDLLANSGGGACLTSTSFSTIDCVAWGTATVPTAGTSAGAIPAGQSLERLTDPGCNTLLESSDDTNSSLADFDFVTPNPEQNSAGQAQFSSCPNTQITKKPKAKTTDRTPKFEFSGGDSYFCVLDGDEDACDNPYEPGRLSRGEHKIEVFALENDGSEDSTPAKYSWKIVRRK